VLRDIIEQGKAEVHKNRQIQLQEDRKEEKQFEENQSMPILQAAIKSYHY